MKVGSAAALLSKRKIILLDKKRKRIERKLYQKLPLVKE